jgi:hypothetical protein
MLPNLDVFDLLELKLPDLCCPASVASARACVVLRVAAQRRRGRPHLKILNVPGELRAMLVQVLRAQGHHVIVGHLVGEIYVRLAP